MQYMGQPISILMTVRILNFIVLASSNGIYQSLALFDLKQLYARHAVLCSCWSIDYI